MGRRILVAEDDFELLDILLSGLRRAEFEAFGVSSGADLLRRAGDIEPHALVVDVGLPDADGRDVCQALRAQGDEVPVLFLTALDTRTDRLSGFSAGGDDYMTKPFDFEELLARLGALIRRSAGSEQHSRRLRCPPAAQAQRLRPGPRAHHRVRGRLLAGA